MAGLCLTSDNLSFSSLRGSSGSFSAHRDRPQTTQSCLSRPAEIGQKRSVTIFAKATAQLPEDRSRLFVKYSTIAARAASLIAAPRSAAMGSRYPYRMLIHASEPPITPDATFVQSISHINLHSVDLKAVSVSASGRLLLVVTGSSCRPESRCRFV